MTQKQVYHEILNNKFIKYYNGHHINKYFLIANPNYKITIYKSDNRIWIDDEYVITQEEFINKFQD